MKLSKAVSDLGGKPDDRCALLSALRPYLRRERQERIDEAIRILKVLRFAELFRGDFF